MAFTHGSLASVAVGGFDATHYLKDVTESAKIETAEVSVLGTVAKAYIPGLEEGTIKATGFLDYNTPGSDATTWVYWLTSLKRTISQLSYMPTGDVLGNPAYIVSGIISDLTAGTSVSAAATSDFSIQGNTGFQRGNVLNP